MTAGDTGRLPAHVAIIMDGNGRWAQARGLPRIEGHKAGAEAVRRTVAACRDHGIRFLTLYAFSTENWRRPPAEIRELMALLGRFLDERRQELHEHRVRLHAIGELDHLPRAVRRRLNRAIEETAGHDQGVLTLALSYGGRAEITAAVKAIATRVANGDLAADDITEETVNNHLYTAGLPDPDLIVRTAGEMRLSNFLLWQASYAEFWSTPKYWPDFNGDDLAEAIRDFNNRERRFGEVTSD